MSKLSKEQQIEDIEKTIVELSKQVESLKKPEEEEFKFCETGGTVGLEGNNVHVIYPNQWEKESERGRIFPTEDLAVKYDKIITNSYKIAQAVAQFAPDYEPDWSVRYPFKYNLAFDNSRLEWYIQSWGYEKVVGVVTFPYYIKDKMLELANSGALGLEF